MNTLKLRKRSNLSMTYTNEDTPAKKKACMFCNGSSDDLPVTSVDNHIYFYCGVSKKSCKMLNIELKKISQTLMKDSVNFKNKDKYIYIHINSYGGSIFAAMSTIDTILNLPIPVISIIEGASASAATLISVVCEYRLMYSNSYMLIHQLSSNCGGKMSQIEDELKNLKLLTQQIKNIYKKYTNLNLKELDTILKHDLWWKPNKCLKTGLIDKIVNNEKLYKIDEDKIQLY